MKLTRSRCERGDYGIYLGEKLVGCAYRDPDDNWNSWGTAIAVRNGLGIIDSYEHLGNFPRLKDSIAAIAGVVGKQVAA